MYNPNREEQIRIFQSVINSDNWDFIFQLFHRFFHLHKGYNLSENSFYHALHNDLMLEFYMDKRIMFSTTWTSKDFLKWFKKWLIEYDDIKLEDKDIAEINRLASILTFNIN